MDTPIQMLDLASQRARLGGRIEAAIARVINHGAFIMGPEVAALEQELAAYCGATHVVTCANGTDALVLVMMAENIGPGDAVFVPSFTFVATAEAVALRGATPVFVDVDFDTFNLSVASLESAIEIALEAGLRPRGVIAVDLFGLAADYDHIRHVCTKHDLLLVADAAQSFGASYKNCRVGTLADYTTTSFFPSKPLGCYGDGGAVLVDDPARAELLGSLRVHGKGAEKYDNVRVGLNSRLDTIQAAVLREKLTVLDDEVELRSQVARAYEASLSGAVATPRVAAGSQSAWAQYTVVTPTAEDRNSLISGLASSGIPTAIYYPTPLHLQTGYRHFPTAPDGCPISEKLSATVLSLPMHPDLTSAQAAIIGTTASRILGSRG
jgi:dTDP-4-amino-4,6-dideoxygalactose transaminase